MQEMPLPWQTKGILGLVELPPCSCVTTGHWLILACAITNGSARPLPVPALVSPSWSARTALASSMTARLVGITTMSERSFTQASRSSSWAFSSSKTSSGTRRFLACARPSSRSQTTGKVSGGYVRTHAPISELVSKIYFTSQPYFLL